MEHVTFEQACAAQTVALQMLRQLAPKAAVGITRLGDDYGLKVNLREPVRDGVNVPTQINGVPVRVHVTGEIRAL